MLMVILKGTMGFTILDEDCIDIRFINFVFSKIYLCVREQDFY